MGGATITLKHKDIHQLLIMISENIKHGETMNLYLNSEIIIDLNEKKQYYAVFHMGS